MVRFSALRSRGGDRVSSQIFPGSDPFIAALLSFSTFFVGFVGRPIGGAIFGHFGDRVGRRKLFILTVMMTGLSTAGIGLVPSYEMIGIWGAVLLTVGRVLQGISLGGAWSGSVLIAERVVAPEAPRFRDQLRTSRRTIWHGLSQRCTWIHDARNLRTTDLRRLYLRRGSADYDPTPRRYVEKHDLRTLLPLST